MDIDGEATTVKINDLTHFKLTLNCVVAQSTTTVKNHAIISTQVVRGRRDRANNSMSMKTKAEMVQDNISEGSRNNFLVMETA